MMKTLAIAMLIACLSPPAVWAFSGSSTNYRLHYGIDGVGLAEGSSTNYSTISNLLYQPVGQYHATSYSLYLGPWYTTGAIGPCGITINPKTEQVFTYENIQFSVIESGSCNASCYTWEISVQGSTGSNIGSSGYYTAGDVGIDEVTVTDACNGDLTDTATVTVLLDSPDDRKHHQGDISLIGAIAMFFVISYRNCCLTKSPKY